MPRYRTLNNETEINVYGVRLRADPDGAFTVTAGSMEERALLAGGAFRLERGEIALYAADDYVDGIAQESGQTIPSSTINNSAVGSALTWSQVLFDTTGGRAWNAANPSRIVIPDGVEKAMFTGSIMFPPNAIGARWVRLTTGEVASHMSNILCPVSHGVASQTVQLNTGWIDVLEGTFYELRAVQDSGSSLVLAMGSVNNKGGSTYLRAAFK